MEVTIGAGGGLQEAYLYEHRLEPFFKIANIGLKDGKRAPKGHRKGVKMMPKRCKNDKMPRFATYGIGCVQKSIESA